MGYNGMNKAESSSTTANGSGTQQAHVQKKPRVLVIDDSRLVRVSIKKVLAEEFDIVEAGDGEDGWDLLTNDKTIQAVLTDAGMPRLDGHGLILRIRAHQDSRIKDIPIMMITGAEAGQVEAREKALEVGATDFVTKPFDKAELIARVRGYTRLDQTQRDLEQSEDTLAKQSVIDNVTKVHNRRYFLQRGEQDLAFTTRHNEDLSIIAISIDQFGALHNQYGDEHCVEILKWSANLIKQMMRKEDTVARVDHSRFAIIAPTAGRMAAAVLCERIRKQFLATPYTETVISLPITISIGLSCNGRDKPSNIEDLLSEAVKRSEQAMRLGGNRTIASSDKVDKAVMPMKVPSIDSALLAIKRNEQDKLKPFLLILARQVLPILELCNTKFHWQIETHLNAIKTKLNNAP